MREYSRDRVISNAIYNAILNGKLDDECTISEIRKYISNSAEMNMLSGWIKLPIYFGMQIKHALNYAQSNGMLTIMDDRVGVVRYDMAQLERVVSIMGSDEARKYIDRLPEVVKRELFDNMIDNVPDGLKEFVSKHPGAFDKIDIDW